jgi:hypothetical protein
MTEAIRSPETSLNFFQNIRRHILYTLHSHSLKDPQISQLHKNFVVLRLVTFQIVVVWVVIPLVFSVDTYDLEGHGCFHLQGWCLQDDKLIGLHMQPLRPLRTSNHIMIRNPSVRGEVAAPNTLISGTAHAVPEVLTLI